MPYSLQSEAVVPVAFSVSYLVGKSLCTSRARRAPAASRPLTPPPSTPSVERGSTCASNDETHQKRTGALPCETNRRLENEWP